MKSNVNEAFKKTKTLQKYSLTTRILRDFKLNKYLYILIIPTVVYYILFHYIPMYGVVIAFKDFSPRIGILASDWVGFSHFESFFKSSYFIRTFKNTLFISLYSLIWGFPAPILLALLLNEVRNKRFKRLVQNVSYLPHFVSVVVICGMIVDFTASDGLINHIAALFGIPKSNLLSNAKLFRTIYISSDIWQGIGWGSIIYLAAISNIDNSLYEAAIIDGANRFKQLLYVTLPSILPTIVILLILRIGGLMSVGFEKIILLYNPLTYETADVISTFVYRKGLMDFDFSFSTAVGMFNSIINFMLLIMANKFSKKVSEVSFW